MSTVLIQFIPLIVFLISGLGFLALFKYREWAAKKAARQNPLTSNLLRPPGETLRKRVDDLTSDVMGYMMVLFAMPVMIYAMALSSFAFGKAPSTVMIVLYIVMVLGVGIYFLIKTHKTMTSRSKYQLGLDAEMYVGQELNQLMRHGYSVFHDFPTDKFNIDHVVIGPNGIFAVETKGRSKSSKKENAKAEVNYDGSTLSFPGWSEQEPIDQAIRQAEWLQSWLTKAIGEPVTAKPILALPGWFIRSPRNAKVVVINGKNSSGFFLKANGQSLSDIQLNRIAHSVEQRCRDVLPHAL